MVHPSEFKALSNAMELDGYPSDVGDNWSVTKFGKSPKMSSYLLAWAVCDFEHTEQRTKRGTVFRIWARRSLLSQTQYAAEIGPEVLEYFEKFYHIPFPLGKQDMIALPDFDAGAMENWGLITYRESNLLYDETSYALSNKQRVAVVIAHELAHQWFGNLVTTEWWDDLWLNEGFASLMEYFGTEEVTHGDFDMMTQFIKNDLQRAMGKDQLASSHPMLIHIGKAYDVYEIFDVISYQKGASIIRMVMEVMGHDDFKKGLTKYLKDYSYSSANHNDLWNSLSKAATEQDWNGQILNISQFADPWTVQMGFPLVSVKRGEAGSITLTQERFKLDPDATEKAAYSNPPYGYEWYIPLWYKAGEKQSIKKDWLVMNEPKKLQLSLNADTWFLLNADVKGYYRTQYEIDMWNLLADQLEKNHSEIPTKSRSQLLSDAFAIAKAGRLPYETALNLTRYLKNEDNYVPFATAIIQLDSITGQFVETENYGDVGDYMLKIITPLYNTYGWNYVVPKNNVLKQNLQSVTISNACEYGHEQCLEESKSKFESMMKDCPSEKLSSSCNKIPPHLRSSIYCSSIKAGTKDDWEFLWKKYETEDIAVEKRRIGLALACTKQSWILKKILNEALKGEIIRHQDTSEMFGNVGSNSVGRLMMWTYFNQNWDKIEKLFGDSWWTINYMIKYAASRMNSEYDISQIQHFLEVHPSAKKFGAFKEVLEKIKIKADWMERNYDNLSKWFKAQL